MAVDAYDAIHKQLVQLITHEHASEAHPARYAKSDQESCASFGSAL